MFLGSFVTGAYSVLEYSDVTKERKGGVGALIPVLKGEEHSFEIVFLKKFFLVFFSITN